MATSFASKRLAKELTKVRKHNSQEPPLSLGFAR